MFYDACINKDRLQPRKSYEVIHHLVNFGYWPIIQPKWSVADYDLTQLLIHVAKAGAPTHLVTLKVEQNFKDSMQKVLMVEQDKPTLESAYLGQSRANEDSENQAPNMRRRSAGPASAAGGAIYARRHFGQVDAHVVAEQMEDMRKMFGEIIQTSTWMDAATKQYAYEKLQAMEFNIGAPDYAYIDLTLDAVLPGVLLRPTDSYATMLRKLQVAAQSQQMSLLPKRKRHSMSVVMSPLVANAYNDLFLNAVCK